jgi:hypothetical protein
MCFESQLEMKLKEIGAEVINFVGFIMLLGLCASKCMFCYEGWRE